MSANPLARGGPVPETQFIRDLSRGVNLSTSREAIGDNECWWLEGAIPIAPGNLTITPGPQLNDPFGNWLTAVGAESGLPTFIYPFNVAGTHFIFVVWANSGNGYVGDTIGTAVTKIFIGTLTSGQTAAAQWNNQGLLIVDPTGYWDWNITAFAAKNAMSQSVQSVTITDGGSGGWTSAPSIAITGGGGSGATAAAYMGIGSLAIVAPGSNYKVGDLLSFNFTLGLAPNGSEPFLSVTSVNGTGGITGVSVINPGQGINIGYGATVALTGGAGTGATGTPSWVVSEVFINTRGSGYTSTPTVTFSLGGPPTRQATGTANVSGVIGGTAIATYAGRAWIASGRSVTFSDAGSYASFVGSGSSFVIEDDYLTDTITALYAANNYLHIFGPDSIDVLSNVTITAAGTASFSRVNVNASIGCNQPNSIFAYNRAVVFATPTGFYSLSGASPEKISDNLDLLLPQIDFSTINKVSGGQVSVAGQLCAAWSISFNDIFTGAGAGTFMLVLYFKGKWFFARQAGAGTPIPMGPIASLALSGAPNFELFTFSSARQPYILLANPTSTYWRVWTKLYDCGKPMTTKQATRAAMGVQMGGVQATRAGLTFTVDSEIHQPGQTTALSAGTFTGYKAFMGSNTEGGGQFMGLGVNGATFSVQSDVSQIQWLAFLYNEVTEWAA